jgi:hypothetical protein
MPTNPPKKEVKAMEDRFTMKRGRTSNAKVDVETRKLIQNTGFSKGGELKYTKTIAMYFHIKELTTYRIERRKLQEITFLQRMDQLHSSMTL